MQITSDTYKTDYGVEKQITRPLHYAPSNRGRCNKIPKNVQPAKYFEFGRFIRI